MSLILITGASGVGKTTILDALYEQHSNMMNIYHFDDIGIPGHDQMIAEYGSVENWQQIMTHQWIHQLTDKPLTKLTIFEGSFNPRFAYEILESKGIQWKLICLHTIRSIREKRLIEERQQPELATPDMDNYAQLLKDETSKLGGVIIDTGDFTIRECVNKIMEYIG